MGFKVLGKTRLGIPGCSTSFSCLQWPPSPARQAKNVISLSLHIECIQIIIPIVITVLLVTVKTIPNSHNCIASNSKDNTTGNNLIVITVLLVAVKTIRMVITIK